MRIARQHEKIGVAAPGGKVLYGAGFSKKPCWLWTSSYLRFRSADAANLLCTKNLQQHGGTRPGAIQCLIVGRQIQNRERTGVPARAARVGWWMRPGAGLNAEWRKKSTKDHVQLECLTRSLPLPVLMYLTSDYLLQTDLRLKLERDICIEVGNLRFHSVLASRIIRFQSKS